MNFSKKYSKTAFKIAVIIVMNNENSNFEMNFQSQINSNFRNLVVNSVRNIQSNKF